MYLGCQQTRNTGELGVYSVTYSGAGNTIPHVEIGNSFSNPDDCSRTAVTQSVRLIETAANRRDGREYAIPSNLADDFANQIRTGLRFLQEIFAGKFARGSLCAG
jgi:hypothetical protein